MIGGTSERTFLLVLISVMIVFFFLRAIAAMGSEYVMARMTNNAAAGLSVKMAKGYLGLPYSFHLQHNSS